MRPTATSSRYMCQPAWRPSGPRKACPCGCGAARWNRWNTAYPSRLPQQHAWVPRSKKIPPRFLDGPASGINGSKGRDRFDCIRGRCVNGLQKLIKCCSSVSPATQNRNRIWLVPENMKIVPETGFGSSPKIWGQSPQSECGSFQKNMRFVHESGCGSFPSCAQNRRRNVAEWWTRSSAGSPSLLPTGGSLTGVPRSQETTTP